MLVLNYSKSGGLELPIKKILLKGEREMAFMKKYSKPSKSKWHSYPSMLYSVANIPECKQS